ncbi:MAG: 16S rRNA (cytidine(1402)-2'-O)-methyltransferase [Leptolyngbya sp. SIO4C1]|nr:16S rRNA (cytidine(1402)-2'-O)-methyltransferase [Leptolyngbya sp. SIO4C1]
MTFRAVRILKEADLIAAEDTRHTGKLLHHFQIATPQVSYHTHNRHKRIPELMAKLQAGDSVALVTDAGMPGISDPGYELVCACAEAGIVVSPVPGASAVVSAIAAAALPTDRFCFEGFLPAKGKVRQARLAQLQAEPRTIMLYESPHRLLKTLQDLSDALGANRSVTLARELTKRYEEFWRGSLAEAVEHCAQTEPRGEFTLAIAGQPPQTKELSQAELTTALKQLLSQGLSPSQASRQLAQTTGLPKRDIYQLSLELRQA